MYRLNSNPSVSIKEKYGSPTKTAHSKQTIPHKNYAVKSGDKVNTSVNDYFSQFKQKPKTIAEYTAGNIDNSSEKVFSSNDIFKSIEKNCKSSSKIDPSLYNKAKRTNPK